MQLDIAETANALHLTHPPESAGPIIRRHVLHIPDDAVVTTLRGKMVIALPPIGPNSPRLTFTLPQLLFAARKRTIKSLYYIADRR